MYQVGAATAQHKKILVSELLAIPPNDIMFDVIGNPNHYRMIYRKRQPYDWTFRPLTKFELHGFIIPKEGQSMQAALQAFETVVERVIRPGPGENDGCGNCQQWTADALAAAVHAGVMIPWPPAPPVCFAHASISAHCAY